MTDTIFSENRRRVMALLRGIDAKPFEMTFSGSGDSGQVDEIGIDEDLECVLSLIPNYGSDEFEYQGLHSILEAFACYAIDAAGHGGWENNDGASGTIYVDPTEGTIRLEIDEYYTASSFSEHTL